MAWFRWYEGTTSDPKFLVIARRTGQPLAVVIAIWAMLLERASEADNRGDFSGFDCEAADVSLALQDGTAAGILAAMLDKGLLADSRVAKWDARQPKREDAESTDRVRAYRARQKSDETQSNDAKRNETLDESRVEENKKTHSAPSGAASASFPLRGKKMALTGKRAEAFDRLWDAFDDKRGKAEAIDAFADIPELTDSLVGRIIRSAERYATESRPEIRAKGGTPKMLQGWITGRRWEDFPDASGDPRPAPPLPAQEDPPLSAEQRQRNIAKLKEFTERLRANAA